MSGRSWEGPLLLAACLCLVSSVSLSGCAAAPSADDGAGRQLAAPVWNADPASPTEVQTLAEHAVVARALKHIERLRYTGLRELIELTQIPAPPFGEQARGERFAQLMRDTGFGEVQIDEVGNVVARRSGAVGRRNVAVLAHLDTVFPPDTDVTVQVDGTRYTAPGIGDNTRGLVLLLELARAVVATDLAFDANVWLVGNVGEEGLGDLRGVRHLFRAGAPAIDSLIAIDGGKASRIVTEAVGSNRFKVTFRGSGGHSWGDFGFASPPHAMGTAIDLLYDRAGRVTRDGPRSSFNVGRIGGGTSVNSIAFEAWMEVDLRSADPDKLAELTEAFESAMRDGLVQHNESRREGPALSLAIAPIGQRPAGNTPHDASLVRHAAAALEYLDIVPEFVASSTDANVPMSLGVPAVTLSRGGVSGRAHSLEEFWIDENTHVATQAVLLTILADAGFSAGLDAD